MIEMYQYRKATRLDGIEERNKAWSDRLGDGEQIKHIRGSGSRRRKGTDKQFVDYAVPLDAD
jgi:hypothetical protein